MSRKEKQEQEAQRDKFRAAVSAMSSKRLTSELEKRQKIIGKLASEGKSKTEEYQETFSQLRILSEEVRNRLGTQPHAARMQVRGMVFR